MDGLTGNAGENHSDAALIVGEGSRGSFPMRENAARFPKFFRALVSNENSSALDSDASPNSAVKVDGFNIVNDCSRVMIGPEVEVLLTPCGEINVDRRLDPLMVVVIDAATGDVCCSVWVQCCNAPVIIDRNPSSMGMV